MKAQPSDLWNRANKALIVARALLSPEISWPRWPGRIRMSSPARPMRLGPSKYLIMIIRNNHGD